ncbi:MAG: hypothetical protein ABI680_13070 [Chthoniobacteraceae bacterium]
MRTDPTKPDGADSVYVFERSFTFHHTDGTTSTGRTNLYKRTSLAQTGPQASYSEPVWTGYDRWRE